MDEQGYYYIIPAELYEAGKPAKAIVYGIVSSLARKTGYCYATNAKIAEKMGLKSVSAIRKWLAELRDDGWIEMENLDAKDRIIRITARFNPPCKITNPPYETQQPAVQMTQQPAVKTAHSNISNSNIISNKQSIANDKTYIALSTLEEIKKQFPSKDVDGEWLKAHDWLEATGKKYRSYPAFFRNWLRRTPDVIKSQGGGIHG